MALLTKQVLEQEGFAVDHAVTGNDAQTLAFVNEYDAIVLDLALPDRNGLTVLQALRKEGKTVPVLVLTGNQESASTVRSLDAGADDYIKKPIVIEEFRALPRSARIWATAIGCVMYGSPLRRFCPSWARSATV